MRVLVIEDDTALAKALAITLRARGDEVIHASGGRAGVDAAAHGHPDLVILDLGLPDLDGTEVLIALRGWSAVPVVVLSARHDAAEKVRCLDAGADDYVTKPFAMDELLARLRAAHRRADSRPDDPVVATSSFTVDLAHRRVVRNGEEVRLTPTEWRLLEVLARNVGKVVGRQMLLDDLRGPHAPSGGHYLRVFLNQLRAKLEDDPAHPRHLLTVPGVGYRLDP
ncbi:MAG: two-component system, OmpR family, operon response regulator KdpE [Actinomycetota bacterium]|nr:two-component system, OmpR family, operon response regulator KdpE [Actinomycetota bacterium]